MTTHDTQSPLKPGQHIGNYIVEEHLRTGGFGLVYVGRHKRITRREVVIKVLLRANQAEDRARFIREATAAAELDHPNVVTIYDYDTLDSGEPYMVMERLKGHDLEDALVASGKLGRERVARLFPPCLQALAMAHERGIVHKDLKPSNLFLKNAGTPQESLVLLDFGIARIHNDALIESAPTLGAQQPRSQRRRLTKTRQVAGTPQYMAPEYILNPNEAPPSIDVYQMGLLMVEAMTGAIVVDFDVPYLCYQAHMKGDLNIPDEILDDPQLGPIVLRATALDPKDRYSNGRAMYEAMREALGIEVVSGNIQRIARTTPRPTLREHHTTNELELNAARMTPGSRDIVADTLVTPEPHLPVPTTALTAEAVPVPTAATSPPPVAPLADPPAPRPPSPPPITRREITSVVTPPATLRGSHPSSAPDLDAPLDDTPPPTPSKRTLAGIAVAAFAAIALGVGGIIAVTDDPAPKANPPKAAKPDAAPSPTAPPPTASPSNPAPKDENLNPWVSITPPSRRVVLGVSANTPKAVRGFRPSRARLAPTEPYAIQAHEVTWGELEPWADALPDITLTPPKSTPNTAKERVKLPATGVPWDIARAYCQHLGGDLPTEAQWEFAARGPSLRRYAWGSAPLDPEKTCTAPPLAEVTASPQDRTPDDVGHPPIYDLTGNALEWTLDLAWTDTPQDGEDKSWFDDGLGSKRTTFYTVRGYPIDDTSQAKGHGGVAYRSQACARGTCASGEAYLKRLNFTGFRCTKNTTKP